MPWYEVFVKEPNTTDTSYKKISPKQVWLFSLILIVLWKNKSGSSLSQKCIAILTIAPIFKP